MAEGRPQNAAALLASNFQLHTPPTPPSPHPAPGTPQDAYLSDLYEHYTRHLEDEGATSAFKQVPGLGGSANGAAQSAAPGGLPAHSS